MDDDLVLGYVSDLDDPDIDPDPGFRRALRAFNRLPGLRTVSSCQGHLPGDQYADVRQTMLPYVTVQGPKAGSAADLLSEMPHFKDCVRRGPKVHVRLHASVMGRWGEVASWLESMA